MARECLIFAGFLVLAALMTWPWVTHLRDAVADPGDPYMIAWSLWWDYHATFHDPLNLFHANVFYPYRYTLAFSEHDYGVALLFFPLFALGLRPLTVHSIATLVAFAFSGYGMFRLARTVTGSTGAAWVAGIAFAFVPYRFHLLSHLHYMFAGWIPLLLEALVLYARARTWRRAAWLGAAFLMNALTSITWFLMTPVPLALSAAFLVVRYRLHRERAFWLRAFAALAAASLLLLPFLWPYHRVQELYGFKFPADDAYKNAASLVDWIAVERRNKFWEGLGDTLSGVGNKLFPGLLPLLLSLAALLLVKPFARDAATVEEDGASDGTHKRLIFALDALAVCMGVAALVAAGLGGARATLLGIKLVGSTVADQSLSLLVVLLVARGCVAYPRILGRAEGRSLIGTLRSERRTDAFWIGLAWAGAGFLGSFGMKLFPYRVLAELFPPLGSLRMPARAAMIAYVGLALLAGLGASRLAEVIPQRLPRLKPLIVYSALAVALLFELRGAPLEFARGAADPDAVTRRLKETPMRGGVVELPSVEGATFNHLYMLRAADHGRPLVNASSSFISPETYRIYKLTEGPGIPDELVSLLEEIPASYLVVRHNLIKPGRRPEYEAFLARGVAAGRLRFIRRFDQSDDLYAVTKTEPDARAEADAPPPSSPSVTTPEEAHLGPPSNDPRYVVRQQFLATLGREPYESQLRARAEDLSRCGADRECRLTRRARLTLDLLRSDEFRRGGFLIFNLYGAAHGRAPTYAEFRTALRQLNSAPRGDAAAFVKLWLEGEEARRRYPPELSDAEFVARVTGASGASVSERERAELAGRLARRETTRAEVLLTLAERRAASRSEFDSAVVAMQYFAHLRRDAEAGGYETWRRVMETGGDEGYLNMIKGFLGSPEYDAKFGSP